MSQSVQIEFIQAPAVFSSQPLGGIVEPGTWEIGFFVTIADNPARGIMRQRFTTAKWFRVPSRLNQKEALDKLTTMAILCGYCKLEIFSLARIEKQWKWD